MTSTFTYEVVNSAANLDRNSWESLVEQASDSSVYWSPGWLTAIEAGIGTEPRHVAVYKDGNLVGLWPNFVQDLAGVPARRLLSIKPGDGGFLLTSDEGRVLDEFVSGIREACRGRVISHTTNVGQTAFLKYKRPLAQRGYAFDVTSRFVLDLRRSWEDVYDDMSKDRRYSIRKARESNHTVRDLSDGDRFLRDFYDAYVRKMSELGASPLPYPFFEEVTTRLGDRIKILEVTVDGSPRGYNLYVLDEYDDRVDHLFSTVVETDFGYYPNELLHEHMMKWAIDNGWKRYDFGGRHTNFEDSVYRYKSQFGGHLEPNVRVFRQYPSVLRFVKSGYKRVARFL